MASFEGFSAPDFDAYAPEKWASHVYNLERLQVKEKLGRLADLLADRVQEAQGLSWELSAEHPALWNNHRVSEQALYGLRPEEERRRIFKFVTRSRKLANLLEQPSPYLEHVHLVVSVHYEGLTCGLALQPEATVDHGNLLKKLADPWQRAEFKGLVEALPDRFEFSVGGNRLEDRQEIPERLESTEVSPQGRGPVFSVQATHARDTASLSGPQALDLVAEELRAVLPLYRFIEWRATNDFLKVTGREEEERKRAAARGLRPKDRVRILAGPLAGQQGLVRSVDAKGQAEVVLGTFTLQIPVQDLAKV